MEQLVELTWNGPRPDLMTIAIRDTVRQPGILGGAALYSVLLAEALGRLVGRVDVFTDDPSAFPSCRTIATQGGYSGSRIRLAMKLMGWPGRPQADISGYDCIIFPSQVEPLVGAPNSRRVLVAHDVVALRFPRYYPRLYLYYKFYFARALRHVDKVVAPSQSTKDELLRYYNLPADHVRVIPNGFNHRLVEVRPEPATGERSGRVAPGDYLLYIGSHLPHKNLPRLVQALALVRRRWDVSLVLVGPPDRRHTPQLFKTARACRVEDAVRILGLLPDHRLGEILRSARGLVLPSLSEGFGMPPLEAMAAGVPVAAARCGALTEVCGDAALFFDPLSIDEMATALGSLLGDQELRDRCVRLGLERVKLFSWDRTAREYVGMIEAMSARN